MFLTLSIFNTIYNDAPQPWQIGFQDSAAPGFTGIVELHNTIFFYLIVICVGVFWVLGSTMYYFNIKNSPIVHKYLNHGRYVPIQKCSKFNNKILDNNLYNVIRKYSTLSYLKNIDHIKVYENASDMRKDILNENKGKSGIYMLTNKTTKDIYIGRSSDISKRFKNYFNLSYLKSQSQKNSIISRALLKNGYSKFSLTILEYCNKSNLSVREQYFIEKLNPQYNILKPAGSSLISKHKEETKAKISKTLKGVYVKEKSALFFSLNTKQSKNIKLKMNAWIGNPVNIYEKFSSEGFKLIGCFVSARRAAKFLGISGSTVIKYKNSGEIFKNRYKFSSK